MHVCLFSVHMLCPYVVSVCISVSVVYLCVFMSVVCGHVCTHSICVCLWCVHVCYACVCVHSIGENRTLPTHVGATFLEKP